MLVCMYVCMCCMYVAYMYTFTYPKVALDGKKACVRVYVCTCEDVSVYVCIYAYQGSHPFRSPYLILYPCENSLMGARGCGNAANIAASIHFVDGRYTL